MFSWIARHIIPHHGNDHRPHLLRGETARYIALLLIVIEVIFFLGFVTNFKGLGSMAAVVPAVLGDLTNEERAKGSLGALVPNPELDEAARLKAQDMVIKGYFAHTSPEGIAPWHWLEKVGYEFEYAGENLAVHFSDSEDVTRAWMDSPTHRANINKAQYTEVGTGIATGVFEGSETVFVVQVYAKPAASTTLLAVNKKVEVDFDESTTTAPNVEQVLGASVSKIDAPVEETPQISPSFLQKAQASPRNSANVLFFIIGAIVALTLAVTVGVQAARGKLNHYDLLTNAIMIFALIGAFYLGNLVVSRGSVEVSFTGFDSAHTIDE